MRAKDALGRYGEDVAARHLAAGGVRILARNWRCRLGELDIVGADGAVLVVCEVKTRRGHAYGDPLEAVTPRKLARLRRLAAEWLADYARAGGGARFESVRLDVVGVTAPPRGRAQIDHRRAVG